MLAKRVLRQSSRPIVAASSSQSHSTRTISKISRRSISSSSSEAIPAQRHPSSGQVRAYSLEQQSFTEHHPDDAGLFSEESAWDSLFANLPSSSTSRSRPGPSRRPLGPGPGAPRRQNMTIREMTAFDDMFSRIFNAASPATPTRKPSSAADPALPTELFSQIKKHSKNVHWASEADEELDRKKEEMSLCESDHQLLTWAQREVFDESVRYEKAAREKMAEVQATGVQPKEPILLQPLSYPHLVALLMRTFRDKYGDPHLALSIFSHARHLSVPSFVFGCTTAAYNELIETQWRCFRDLRGVCDALEEMQANAVSMDSKTKALCETVRRECGARELWSEERSVGSGEVWEMIQFIDKVVAGVNDDMFSRRMRDVANAMKMEEAEERREEKKELGAWKKQLFDAPEFKRRRKEDDEWGFDQWEGRALSSRGDESAAFA